MCKTKSEFKELVEKFRKLTAKQKKVEQELSAVKSDMAEYILAKGVKSEKSENTLIVLGEDFKVSYIVVTRQDFDTKKLNEFFGDRAIEFKKAPITFPRFDVR